MDSRSSRVVEGTLRSWLEPKLWGRCGRRTRRVEGPGVFTEGCCVPVWVREACEFVGRGPGARRDLGEGVRRIGGGGGVLVLVLVCGVVDSVEMWRREEE